MMSSNNKRQVVKHYKNMLLTVTFTNGTILFHESGVRCAHSALLAMHCVLLETNEPVLQSRYI